MAVGFELARSNGWVPRGEFAEVPGGTPCRGCAALREELSRLRREGTEARWAANYWRSMHDRSQARARLERKESARLRSASALRELERTASGLRHENVRLRSRVEELEGGNDRLRARNRRLTKERFGRRSERRRGRGSDSGAAARTGRPRGRQAGTASHGRTPRPALAVESETVEPAERSCPRCGRAYVANGAKTTELTEVEVRAHVRRVHRVRRRAACACAPGRETLAPAVPRLFPNTPYGVSVWALFLLEKYAHHRPLRAVSRMLSAHGLDLAPGTLADSLPRFVPLFAPLVAAIAERQAAAHVAHGDETSWTIHARGERGDSPRCWLWVCLTADAVRLRVDPSRSAAAARELFAGLGAEAPVHLVCDRYAAYAKLAREEPERFVLALCWAHARRDFIDATVGRPQLGKWSGRWLERIAALYRGGAERARHWDRALPVGRQGAAFAKAQGRLEGRAAALFERARRELAALPADAPQGKPLRALERHREGLTTFLRDPAVPLDNNAAERALRGAAIGRKLSFGSHSETGAELAGHLYSVFGTLALAGLRPYPWLADYLQACAESGGRPPADARAWLPWGMDESNARRWRRRPAQGP